MDIEVPDAPSFALDHRVYRSFFLVGLVILLYDYLLTLEMEVKYIWQAQRRLGAIWFFLVRYTGLISSIIASVFYTVHMSHQSCVTMQIVWEVLIMMQEVLIEVTIGLRVFAMYGLNIRILLFLAIMAGLAGGLALWAIFTYGIPIILPAPPGLNLPGCHTAFPRTTSLRLAGAWEAQIVYDTCVFLLTVRRAITQRRMSPLWAGTLMEGMLRDGGMYFGIIVLVNMGNLLTFYLGDALLSGFLSWFTTSLSVTLLSRLMLNLHRAGRAGTDPDSTLDISLDLDTLRFPPAPADATMDVATTGVYSTMHAPGTTGEVEVEVVPQDGHRELEAGPSRREDGCLD